MMRPALPTVLVATILVPLATPRAQNAGLLVDALPGIRSSMREGALAPSPRYGQVLLALDDGVHGIELWRTDGTAAGTTMVRELTPGPYSSEIIFPFAKYDAGWFTLSMASGDQIWHSDGTTAGTRMIIDGASLGMRRLNPPQMLFSDGSALLVADGSFRRSDGTVNGTTQLGIPDGYVAHSVGDEFWISDYQSPTNLWHSRGTRATTSVAATGITAARAHLGGMIVFQDLGGAQTRVSLLGLGTGVVPSIILPEPAVPALVDGAVLAFGTHTLWRWDAQSAPTVLHVFASLTRTGWGLHTTLPGVNGTFFNADDGVSGEELWFTDYTANGTRLFVDVTPGPGSTKFGPSSFLVNGKAVFWLDSPALNVGSEPWVTDGTVAGTVLLGDLAPGLASSDPDPFIGLTGGASQRRMIGLITTPQYGAEPWVTDGTPGGTRLVADIRPGRNSSMTMFGYYALHAGPNQIFVAADGVHGFEPWVMQLEGVATPLRAGCSPSGTYSMSDPVLGSNWQLRSSGTTRTGVAVLSLPNSTPIAVGGGCVLHLDPATSIVLATITPNAAGDWRGSLPLPATRSLRGARFVSQAAYLPSAHPLGVDLADAWSVTPGL
ncbi:MAG: hypothetical protein R3F56_23235 [Planctomycetota bacterium]